MGQVNIDTVRGPFLSHNQHTTVDLWHETTSENQLWKLTCLGGDIFTIEAVSHTRRGPYLSHDCGAKVDLWHSAGDNQKWRITQRDDETYTIAAVVSTRRG